jgi:hypothetical protein
MSGAGAFKKWCDDHQDFCGGTCPDCGLEVDDHGNTEAQFEYCCSPDCGCPESRLCMANGAREEHMRGFARHQRRLTIARAGFGEFLK